MSNPGPLYGFTIAMFTEDLDDDGAITPHREIDIRSVLRGENAHLYPNGDLASVARWHAGILARFALTVRDMVGPDSRHVGHRCGTSTSGRCGLTHHEGVVGPADGGGPMVVTVTVPTEQVDQWMAIFRRWLSELVAEAMATVGVGPSEHGRVRPTDPAANRKATR